MAAIEDTFDPEALNHRTTFVSKRWIIVTSLVISILVVGGLVAYTLRGSPVDRGSLALIEAFSSRRLIEPRLCGGFKGGEFRPSITDRSNINWDKLEEAGELIRDSLAKGDLSAQLPYARLLLLSEDQKLPEALKYLRRVVASEPESAEAHNDLGAGLLQQGKLEDALDELDAALKHNANMPEALFNRALCYQHLLLREAAGADFSRLLGSEPDKSWLHEVRERHEEVSAPLAPKKREDEIVAAFDEALAGENIDEANRIQDQNGEIIVKHAYGECANKFVKEGLARNNELAERALSEMELIGSHFAETRNDKSVIDFAKHLRNLPNTQRENDLKLIGEYNEEEKLLKSQRTDEAQAKFDQLGKRFADRGNDAFQYFCTLYSAILQYNAGNLAASIDVLRHAQAILERHSWPYHRAVVLEQLAIAHSRLGRDALAIEYCEQALKLSQNFRMVQAKALQYMSNAYGHLGDLDNRLASLRESTRIYLTSVPTLRDIASNYLDIAELYRFRANHPLALLYASESLTLSNRANDNNRAAEASSFTAVEHARLSQSEQAEEFLTRAIGFLDKLEIDQRAHAEQFVLTRAAEIAETNGDHLGAVKLYSDAEAVLEKVEGNTILLIRVLRARAEAYAQQEDCEKARSDLTRAIQMIEGYRSSIKNLKNRSDFLDASQGVFDQMIVLEISAFKRGPEAFNFSEQSRARTLLDEFSVRQNASSVSKQVKPFKLERVQKELPDNMSLLTYSVTNQRTFLFLTTRTGFEVAESPATTELLDRLVQDYVSSLKEMAPLEDVNEKARTLYRYLIAPIAARIRDGKTLCIAPDKALHFLPFAALVDDSGRYLIESCPLTYTPSASALVLSIEEGRAKRTSKDDGILAVGNPRFNRDRFPKLDDLHDAGREATESAAFYSKATILNDLEATEDRVKMALKDCDVAHLAVHCLVQEKSPWLAALVLASQGKPPVSEGPPGSDGESLPDDGLLYLNEVYGMSLPHTRLVVLSACQSGLGRYYRGEGIVSLVRPFLAVGVPTVVASLWKVDSQATSAFMIEFHRARRLNHRTTGGALRDAEIKMAQTDSYRHPFYWAPFIAVGSDN